ncbi:prephenate dehydratase [Azotosporobacter soli]|uniref:prephenate dehydratase n=1 Tax=Azotosporobacter soli TaxID=3055040 RepID=UPI0031FED395
MRQLAFLGPHGTHSEELARLAFPDRQLTEYPTIADCLQAVADLHMPAALVPIENSLEGTVNITLDLLSQDQHLFITKEFVWPIRHHLLTYPGSTDAPHTIFSHPQALAQCRQYIRRNYPDARLTPVDSTAAAALTVSQRGFGHAAIAARRSADLYQLVASENHICDSDDNHTRFVLVEPTLPALLETPAKTSIVCRMQGNKPGSLYLLLEVFARHNINLVRIESRPARTRLGEYSFFLDLEGSLLDPPIAETLRSIREHCSYISILGCYPTVCF